MANLVSLVLGLMLIGLRQVAERLKMQLSSSISLSPFMNSAFESRSLCERLRLRLFKRNCVKKTDKNAFYFLPFLLRTLFNSFNLRFLRAFHALKACRSLKQSIFSLRHS